MNKLIYGFTVISFCFLLSGCNKDDVKPTYYRQLGESCDIINNCDTDFVCIGGSCRIMCQVDDDCANKKQYCKTNFCADNPDGNCRGGWSGTNCDTCAANHYGPNCQECPKCGHGKCNATLEGDGHCQCAEGWTGTLCDECADNHYGQECQECPVCGAHAKCRQTLTGTGECECLPAFTGDGCTECADKRFMGPECTLCSDDRFTGDGCTECSDKRFAGQNCDECIDGAVDFLTDKSGREYGAICLNKQFWMTENLLYYFWNYTYPNGYYYNASSYGLLYDWETANVVCPAGWHLPEIAEYEALFAHLQEIDKKLKITESTNDGCSDESGFCVQAAGLYFAQPTETYSEFTVAANLWTATAKECSSVNGNRQCAHLVRVDKNGASDMDADIYNYQTNGAAVRCVQDSCTDSRFTGKDCDECADKRFMGANCDECNPQRAYKSFSGSQCNFYGSLMFDNDGNSYKTVNIGGQIWMAENMRYKGNGVNCLVRDDAAGLYEKYGCFYNWTDAGKVCPTGWHLPSRDEFSTLMKYARGYSRSGDDYQALAASAGNDFGFSGLTGGGIYYDPKTYEYSTTGKQFGYWWSSTENLDRSGDVWAMYINSVKGSGAPGSIFSAEKDTHYFSVRCVKN